MYVKKLCGLLLALMLLPLATWAEIQKEFYESGELKAEKTITDGRLTAEKRYRIDSQIEYEMYYEGKKKVEKEYQYYATGELFRKQQRVSGLMEGWETDLYPSGKIKAKRHYVGGKKNGKAQGFYENGQVQGDWEFKDGAPVDATIYHPNGEVYLKHKFKEGKLNGWTEEYNIKGKHIARRLYKDDRMVKRDRR